MIGLRLVGAFVASLVGVMAGRVAEVPPSVSARFMTPRTRGAYTVSAYCGRYGGQSRIRRAIRDTCGDFTDTTGIARLVLEKTRRDVACDKRRVRARHVLTSTGLPAFPR